MTAGLVGCGLVGAAAWCHRRKRRDIVWSVGDSLSEIVKAHGDYLLVKHPAYYDKFQNLVHADREAAMGEAAVFSILRTYFRAEPEPADEPGAGGVDFICRKNQEDAFVLEVTSLKPDSVARKSGIPVTADEGAAHLR